MYDSIMGLFQVIGFPDRGIIDKREDYCQRILQALFLAVCPTVRTEERTSIGKSDDLVEFPSRKVLLELKVIAGSKVIKDGHSRLDEVVQDALEQAEQRYATGLSPDVICALVFNTSTRTLFPREKRKVPFWKRNQL